MTPMKRTPRVPSGLYGATDGLAHPDRPTLPERLTRSPERLAEDVSRARSRSPLLARLRRVALNIPAPTRGLGR